MIRQLLRRFGYVPAVDTLPADSLARLAEAIERLAVGVPTAAPVPVTPMVATSSPVSRAMLDMADGDPVLLTYLRHRVTDERRREPTATDDELIARVCRWDSTEDATAPVDPYWEPEVRYGD